MGQKRNRFKLRLLPCSAHRTEPMATFLSEQAKKGLLFRGSFFGLAWFSRQAPETIAYDIRWHYDSQELRGKYVGKIFPGYTVFRADGAAGIARQKNTGGAVFLLTAFLLGMVFLILFARRGDPVNFLYPEWLLQWEHFLLLPLIGLFALSALGVFFSLCPGLCKLRLAGLHYCRMFLSLLFLLLLCVCVTHSAIQPGFQVVEPIFSDTGSSVTIDNSTVLCSQIFYYESMPGGQNISMSKSEFSTQAVAEYYFSWLSHSIFSKTSDSFEKDNMLWYIVDNTKNERYILILDGTQVYRLRLEQDFHMDMSELGYLAVQSWDGSVIDEGRRR